METLDEARKNEKHIARGVGRMVGIAAIRDCYDSGSTNPEAVKTYKEAGELVGYGMKFDPTEFLKGIADACLIAIQAENDSQVMAGFIILARKD